MTTAKKKAPDMPQPPRYRRMSRRVSHDEHTRRRLWEQFATTALVGLEGNPSLVVLLDVAPGEQAGMLRRTNVAQLAASDADAMVEEWMARFGAKGAKDA